jgi:Uma2 family endonuclease
MAMDTHLLVSNEGLAMATAPASPPPSPLNLTPGDFFRLSLDQYHEMVRMGVLADDAPVELLDGWLITKMSKNPPHTIASERLWKLLLRILPAGWDVMAQQPITLETSEPEPDAAVLRGNRDDYPDRHPGPEDVPLVIEVADASLERDRTWKRRLYARAGIERYWIVNLVGRSVEVFSDPMGRGDDADYSTVTGHGEGEDVPLILDGREVARVAVRDVLPRA